VSLDEEGLFKKVVLRLLCLFVARWSDVTVTGPLEAGTTEKSFAGFVGFCNAKSFVLTAFYNFQGSRVR
jgi:hypothetical protein